MKYLPKSKLGAVIAVLYLLFILVLTTVGLSGGGGHGNPAVLLLALAFILTLPTSLLETAIMDYISPSPPANSSAEEISVISILVVSAVINAIIIYLAVGFISRALQKLFKKPIK